MLLHLQLVFLIKTPRARDCTSEGGSISLLERKFAVFEAFWR
jgi:hypothetical protein